MSEDDWYCEACGRVGADHYLKNKSDPKHSIREVTKPGNYEADFTPNVQPTSVVEQLDAPIQPPMTAKEFRRHCKRIAENKEKPMVTRLAAFGLGALVEGVTDGINEVLGTPKKKSTRRLKR